MLEQLFRFPVVHVDLDNEERKIQSKQKYGDLPNQSEEVEEFDVVYGEAEYPFQDLVGLEDRWLPTTESFQKALAGEFEACLVRFMYVGQLLVPLPKEKFKAKLLKFAEKFYAENPPREKQVINVKTLSMEEARKLLGEDD